MAESKRGAGRGARGVMREIEQELARVEKGLSGYEPLLRERERLLAARAALAGEGPGGAGRARTSQDDVAAFLAAHPDSWPADVAAALDVPVTNVSAHLYRGKRTRFQRGEHGWRIRLAGGSDDR